MLNKFINYNDGVIALIVDSEDKYGLHVLISEHRLEQVSNATKDYWKLKYVNDKYVVYTVCEGKIIYLNKLIIGIHNEYIEEKFIEFESTSDRLIPNIHKGKTYLLEYKNFDSLVNTDENLCINDFLITEYNDKDYGKYLEDILYTIDEESMYDYDIQTILNIEDNCTKNYILNEFKKMVYSFFEDKLFKRIYPDIKHYKNIFDLYENDQLKGEDLLGYSASINLLSEEYQQIYDEHYSTYYFEGHLLIIYPSVKVLKANKIHLCSFTGARIYKGSYYNRYKLFIEDMTDGALYVTDDFMSEIGADVIFPTTVRELDDFLYKLSICYENDLDEYYEIACNMKSDTLGIKLVKRKNR